MSTRNTNVTDPLNSGAYWQVLLAGFANPKYVGPTGQLDAAGALGFYIGDCQSILSSIDSTTSPAGTLVAEQTLDPTGLTGWVAVQGKRVDSVSSLTSNVNTVGVTYIFPRAGIRMRFRVTALATADLRMRIFKTDSSYDLAPGAVVISSGSIAGVAAQDAAISGNPIPIAGDARDAVKSQMSAEGDVVIPWLTRNGRIVDSPWAPPALSWSYAAAGSGIVNTTTAITAKSAAGAGIRNVVESLHISHDVLGAVTEWVLYDGGSAIMRGKLNTAAQENINIILPRPLRGTANTAINFGLLTAVTGGVYVNLAGHTMND